MPFLRAYATNARAGTVVVKPGKLAQKRPRKRTAAANKLSADDMKE